MSSKAAFVFPSASGHLNPSLPLARRLVSLGWVVEYISIPQFQEAIEDTGARFLDRNEVCRELGVDDVTEMIKATFAEYDDPAATGWALNFGSIATQKLLPVYTEWLRGSRPQLVVYCPVLCQVAHFAAMKLGIPDVSLLTAAGPGFFDAAMAAHPGFTADGLISSVKANQANSVAVESIREQLGMPELSLNTTVGEPLIGDYYTGVNLVSTTAELADELNSQDTEFYRIHGKKFEFVGPLLDTHSTKRAGGVAEHPETAEQRAHTAEQHALVMSCVEEAAGSGRAVVYVSMGTVLTGYGLEHGWAASSGSLLTGKQLCQAVCAAVFEELQDCQGSGPLIILSTGPQPDALEGLQVPANAVCARSVPQLEVLRRGQPVLFVSNGGQNSLMESMAAGSPVVVCPGFGDQQTNAAKVCAQGWGVKVDRPVKAEGAPEAGEACQAAYQAAVQEAVREVLGAESFRDKARVLAAGLKQAEGVEGAVRILLDTAASGASAPAPAP